MWYIVLGEAAHLKKSLPDFTVALPLLEPRNNKQNILAQTTNMLQDDVNLSSRFYNHTSIDMTEFETIEDNPSDSVRSLENIVDSFRGPEDYYPATLAPKRSFTTSHAERACGYVVHVPTKMDTPYPLMKQSLFSVACAYQFKMPSDNVTPQRLEMLLKNEFDEDVVDPAYRATFENTSLDAETGRDKQPWVETLGSAGVAGYYKRTTGVNDWLAFVLVSELDAPMYIYDNDSESDVSDIGDRKTIAEFMDNVKIRRVQNVVHRCARRILARLLGHVGYSPMLVPDVNAADPRKTLDMNNDNLNDTLKKLLYMRVQPFMAVPDYEQEFDVFVPGSIDGMAYYCNGVVPSSTMKGGLMISAGGSAPDARLKRIVLRNAAHVKDCERMFARQKRFAKDQGIVEPIAPIHELMRKRIPSSPFYDTWMHSGVGLNETFTVYQAGTDASVIAKSMDGVDPRVYESFARFVRRSTN